MAELEIHWMIFLRLARWSHAYVKLDKPLDIAYMFSCASVRNRSIGLFFFTKGRKKFFRKDTTIKYNRQNQKSSRKIRHCFSALNIVAKRETLSNMELVKFVWWCLTLPYCVSRWETLFHNVLRRCADSHHSPSHSVPYCTISAKLS